MGGARRQRLARACGAGRTRFAGNLCTRGDTRADRRGGSSMKDISQSHIEGKNVVALVETLRSTARLAVDIRKDKAQAPDPSLVEVRRRAEPILEAADPLTEVETAIRALGYGGSIWAVLLVYLAA